MNRPRHPHRHRRLIGLWACGLAFALSFKGATAQEDLPRVAVTIENASPIFDDLIRAHPALTAELVREHITVPAKDTRWGYLEWLDRPAPDAAAEWIIKLEQKDVEIALPNGSVGKGTRIQLNHYARIGDGDEFALKQFNQDTQLYSEISFVPTQDHRQFTTDLSGKLKEQLTDAFTTLIEDSFLKRIPLTRDIVFDTEKEFVIVPIRRSDIRATKDTILGIEFKSEEEFDGQMTIRAASLIPSGDRSGFIMGHITAFSLPRVELTADLPAWWDNSLPDIFENALEKTVYMVDYYLDPAAGAATAGGTVLVPD